MALVKFLAPASPPTLPRIRFTPGMRAVVADDVARRWAAAGIVEILPESVPRPAAKAPGRAKRA